MSGIFSESYWYQLSMVAQKNSGFTGALSESVPTLPPGLMPALQNIKLTVVVVNLWLTGRSTPKTGTITALLSKQLVYG